MTVFPSRGQERNGFDKQFGKHAWAVAAIFAEIADARANR
jgi:hypothetical protein